MTAPVIYFAGGEDSEFFGIGSTSVSTTAGRFRSAFARCALIGFSASANALWWVGALPYSASNFWFSARVMLTSQTTGNANAKIVTFLDSSGIERLRMRISTTTFPWTVVVEKVDAAGAATQLGSSFTLSIAVVSVDQLVFHINYDVSGSIDIYLNGASLFSFSGDVTTNSVTSLANHAVYSGIVNSAINGACWSEVIVTDTDNRSWSLQTLAPAANGNTHNFDTGSPAAANVNETTLNDATLDGSTTAGQINQYTIPALATGTFGIIAVGMSARMQKGSSGPSKMDLNVRSGGSDYFSADQVLTLSWACYQNWWYTDPNTAGLTWTALPANIGLKSVT